MKRTSLHTKKRGLVALVFALCTCLCLACCLAGCSGKAKSKFTPLDYSLSENWYMTEIVADSDYDLLFFVGTSFNTPDQENGVATNITDEVRAAALSNYVLVGSQLSAAGVNTEGADVYIPAYRQMALSYALSTYTTHEGLTDDIKAKEPGADVYAFLDYYFTNINKDGAKPFVIAGHSQGSAAIQCALEEYFIGGNHQNYLTNMVAMYSVGYGVSEKWFNGLNKKYKGEEVIHFASGADDTGCLISWNTEGPGEKDTNVLLADAGDKTLIINPLTWKTDETYAGTELNKGVLDTEDASISVTTDTSQLFDAQIDSERGSLICTTNQNYATIPGFGAIFGGKSLHLGDGPGYYANMGANLHERLMNFLAARE